jgi:hypothetical protein
VRQRFDFNGTGGPFNANDIRCALERLCFRLDQAAEKEGEAEVYVHADGGFVPLDPATADVYYGDRWFQNTAGAMAGIGLAGSMLRRAVEQRMLLLRTHLLACRDQREGGGGDDG